MNRRSSVTSSVRCNACSVGKVHLYDCIVCSPTRRVTYSPNVSGGKCLAVTVINAGALDKKKKERKKTRYNLSGYLFEKTSVLSDSDCAPPPTHDPVCPDVVRFETLCCVY